MMMVSRDDAEMSENGCFLSTGSTNNTTTATTATTATITN